MNILFGLLTIVFITLSIWGFVKLFKFLCELIDGLEKEIKVEEIDLGLNKDKWSKY